MRLCLTLVLAFFRVLLLAQGTAPQAPHLQRQGNAYHLIVNDKPFMVLGGELGNSSSSSLRYMKPIWQKLTDMHVNTVLMPVYWELIEPAEGRYDFELLDSLVVQARQCNLKLVLLWFGAWKNSMSCYVPDWIKKDQKRFPRAQSKQGISQEILSPFSKSNLDADIKVFGALMRHIRETDRKEQTVIMVQVENEIGMLPDARDYSPAANEAFSKNVPEALLAYLKKNKDQLAPNVLKSWQTSGFKQSGTWDEIFGKGLATDEIFIAWYFAQFADKVTEAGKKIYPLPMFVNAALNRPNVKPGDYPSGGPLPHIIDIWKAGAPAVDFLSPDFYNPDFAYWNDLYTRTDNPLFIPEIRFEPSVAAKVFFAMGHYHAIGFAPFSIESTDKPLEEPIGKSYGVLSQLVPVIGTQSEKTMDGVLLDKKQSGSILKFGEYTFTVRHDYTLGWSPNAQDEQWPFAGGLVIQTGEDEFIVTGTGIVLTFSAEQSNVGILNIEEGSFVDNQWTPVRRMNGDQSHQGRHLRFPVGVYGMQKLKLYKYR